MTLTEGGARSWLDLEEISRTGRCDLSGRGLAAVPPEILQLSGLEILDLSNNQLAHLPPEIGQLGGLRELLLGRNRLAATPPEIRRLTRLEVLDLSDNQLTALPAEVTKLPSLKQLNLAGNGLAAVPAQVGTLGDLQELRLHRNRLSSLPTEIRYLTNLQKISLGGNRLSSVPLEITYLSGLRELQLGGNRLTGFPPQISKLARLQVLSLSGSLLTAVPPEIMQLTSLQKLDLSGNQLTAVPPEIQHLTDLRELMIGGNQLTYLPPEIRYLGKLEVLDASGSQLRSVPPEIGSLSALRELWLGSNQLTEVPPEIGHLTELRQLRLGRNQLTSLPPQISALTRLEMLDLSDNRLSVLPEAVASLIALRQLWLGSNRLSALPPEIGALAALESLDLGANFLGSVPPEAFHLTNLRVLWLDGNQISSLPPEISSLTKLRKLWLGGQHSTALIDSFGQFNEVPARLADEVTSTVVATSGSKASGNQITKVPPEINQLHALETLGLGANQITSVPPEIGRLAHLTTLDLSDNRLASVPDEIGQLTRLGTLNLRGNRLTGLPGAIGRLTALQDLDLSRNQLVAVPDEIGQLTMLRTLNLLSNRLTAFPASIGRLAALQQLDLTRNLLPSVPEEIGHLTGLRGLSLGNNRLNALPAVVTRLSGLQWLNLPGNQLTTLPDQISRLRGLKSLYLTSNQLTSLPDEIGQLTALEVLEVGLNPLTEVPSWVGEMTSLRRLDLRHNRIVSLPWQFSQLLESETSVVLVGNPFREPVLELLEYGPLVLGGYLRSLQHAAPQYEAKILLVGEGNVGKTSLIAALRGEPFIDGRITTHGIEIRPLYLSHPETGQELAVRSWDFGGQEVYRVSHQFFFTENALYLLVWKPREGYEQNEVEGWLRRIRLRVGNGARVLIVATHCAGGRHPDLDYPRLSRTFPALLAGQFEVDNETGQGLTELRQAISTEVAALPQMGQRLSPQWIAARHEVLGLAESEPQISLDRFDAICRAHGVGSEEAKALLALLHILGRIVYYGDDDGLRDFVVLNPEWLTKAISYVLEDASTRQAGGILDHARLREIWQHPPEGPGYPRLYHPYFLRLMEKFDISYRLEDDPYRSLVAQLTPHERPNLPWDAHSSLPGGVRRLALCCRLSEPVPGLIAWLTVRHHRAATGLHWRSGVFLRHPIPAYSSEALIELLTPDMLSLEVRAPSPDYFFNVLRDGIEDLMTRRWPGLSYELLIPCPGADRDGTRCPSVLAMQDLQVYREEGESRYLCPRCRTRHDISALLTGFPVQQPGMDQIYAGINQVRDEITGLSAGAAQTADLMRKVLAAVTTEITDCPRLFTLTSADAAGVERLKPGRLHYRLLLWCEHPGHWHPWPAATYDLAQPAEWLLRIAPAATAVFKILQLAAPIASAAAGLALTALQTQNAQNEIQLATALINALPTTEPRSTPGLNTESPRNQLSPAQGEAWRAVRALLFEHDPARSFGDLRRVQAPSGEFLWVCREHYPDYDPGLPSIRLSRKVAQP